MKWGSAEATVRSDDLQVAMRSMDDEKLTLSLTSPVDMLELAESCLVLSAFKNPPRVTVDLECVSNRHDRNSPARSNTRSISHCHIAR